MLATLLCALVVLALLVVRKHPTLARDLGENLSEFRKELERHLSRLGEEIYWSQYESGNDRKWERRWKSSGAAPARNARFWAPRRRWHLGLGRLLKRSQY
jgi:hypothetical protein